MFRAAVLTFGLCASCTAAAEIAFVEVGQVRGLDYDQTALWTTGAAVADVDGDGWEDVLFVGGEVGIRLYANNGDGTFTDVSSATLPPDLPNGAMALFADFDNDGDPDIALGHWNDGYWRDLGCGFLVNDGGLFSYGPWDFAMNDSFGGSMTAGDVDRDGDLDLVRLHYFGPGHYLRQDAPFVFTDATSVFGAGLGEERRHWQGVLTDFNQDGELDLHVAIDFEHDYQCRNLGGGMFEDVSQEANVSNVGADMGLAIGDIDNDLDQDIYSTNIGWHALYVNDGTGTFSHEAAERGCEYGGAVAIAWGTQFADLDHDGDLDLVMTQSGATGQVFINDGTGYFTRDLSDNGFRPTGYGLLAFDFDRDGDLDVLSTNKSGNPRLFENMSSAAGAGGWLIVRLRGRISNRDGVGARIYATTQDGVQMRDIICGQSFVSGPPMYAHFGLGTAPAVERLEVHWPSGIVQVLEDVAPNQHLIVTEGDGSKTFEFDPRRKGRDDDAQGVDRLPRP